MDKANAKRAGLEEALGDEAHKFTESRKENRQDKQKTLSKEKRKALKTKKKFTTKSAPIKLKETEKPKLKRKISIVKR